MKRVVFSLLLLVSSGLLGARESESQQSFVIAVNNAYSDDISRSMIEALFTTMYAPLGIQPIFQYLPSRRGLQSANRFEVDAEAGRVLSVAKQYPNLVTINAPMVEHHVYLFCLEAQHCEKSPDTLYAVVGGFQAAYQYCERHGLDCLFEHSLSFMGQLLHTARWTP